MYYQVAQSQLLDQYQRNRDLDIKLVAAIATAATLGGITAVVLKDFTGSDSTSFTPFTIIPVIIITVGLVVTNLSAIFGLLPRAWRGDPDLCKFSSYLHDYDDVTIAEWAGDQLRNAVRYNETVLFDKSKSLVWCMIGLLMIVVPLPGVALELHF